MQGEIPLSTSLTKAVETFAKTPIGGRKSEAVRNTHVNFLLKGSIEVGCFDVELAKLVVLGGGNGEEGSNGVPPGNRCESECEILSGDLGETLCDEAGFEPRDVANFITLDPKYPFALHGFATGRKGINLFIDPFCF